MSSKFIIYTTAIILVGSLLFSCMSTKSTPNLRKEEKLSLLLKKGVAPSEIESSFAEYGLQGKGRISRTENKYRFIFDPQKIDSKSLLEKINASELVLDVKVILMASLITPSIAK